MPVEENGTGQFSSREDSTAQHSFDDLARGLASGSLSRRRALRLLGGALAGSLIASFPGVAGAAELNRNNDNNAKPCPDPQKTRCNGVCVDKQTNKNHCGRCRIQCKDKETCCGGDCVRLKKNENHCGSCGNSCKDKETCCGGDCVRLKKNENHCGSCGNSCKDKETCCG